MFFNDGLKLVLETKVTVRAQNHLLYFSDVYVCHHVTVLASHRMTRIVSVILAVGLYTLCCFELLQQGVLKFTQRQAVALITKVLSYT